MVFMKILRVFLHINSDSAFVYWRNHYLDPKELFDSFLSSFRSCLCRVSGVDVLRSKSFRSSPSRGPNLHIMTLDILMGCIEEIWKSHTKQLRLVRCKVALITNITLLIQIGHDEIENKSLINSYIQVLYTEVM